MTYAVASTEELFLKTSSPTVPGSGAGNVPGARPKNVTEVRELLYAKAPVPMVRTELPIVTEVSEEAINASAPIDVTELGIVTEVRAVFANAPSRISVTELPIVTEVSDDARNALLPIDVTELGITRLVSLEF